MHEFRSSSSRKIGPALARGTQAAILAGVVLVAGVAFWGVPALLAKPDAVPATVTADAAAPPGTFKPTDAQWAELKMAPVQSRGFRTAEDTDGKIALNGDTVTRIYSQYSGRVTRVFAKEGDRVAQGAPLFAIEASEFVQGQNDLVAAAATLATARAQLRLAEAAEKRQHALFAAKGAALKDWQQAQVDLANAQGGVRTAEIGLAAVRNRLRILGRGDQDIARLERQGEAGRMPAEAVVRAPIAGTVVTRAVGTGQYINSAANGETDPVFAIGDLSTVWLVANLREVDADKVHVGDDLVVHALALPGRAFHAKVSYVAPAIDPNTRRLAVRAVIGNADGALKPEMFAAFRVLSGAETMASAVPGDAVVYEGDTARVWVADPRTKSLGLRRIVVGRSSDGWVEVSRGLSVGETIVTSGALFIDRAASGT